MARSQPLCIVDTDTQSSRIYNVAAKLNVGSGNIRAAKASIMWVVCHTV